MSSGLPSEDAADMAVDDFGLGPWDSDPTSSKGQDAEGMRSELNPRGKSLPDAGGSSDAFNPERLLSYPGTFASRKARFLKADYLRAIGRGEISADVSMEEFEAAAGLPSDENNPSARSDYYDRMTMGLVEEAWADEDAGVYAQEGDETLPTGSPKNESTVDNFLNSLGNFWSGTVTEDVTKPEGPTQDYMGIASEDTGMHRKATNHDLVSDLTASFLKEFGKKDLTRRHVMAFLQKQGYHQYLASDIIRCLKLSHSVFVKDVLDEFPVVKTATQGGVSLAALREKLIRLEVANITNPDVAYHIRRCAARISHIMADLERLEARNG